MRPPDLARLVVDRFNNPLAPQPVIRARQTISAIRWLVEVDAVGMVGTHDKQARLRVIAGRAVVGQASLIRCNQDSVGRWLLDRVWNRTSFLVHFLGPIYRPEGNRQQALTVSAIKNEKITVARCLQQHLPWLTVEASVHQYGYLDRIPIVGVVGRRLERPHQLARVRVEGHDAAGIKVVARARTAVQYRGRIPRSPIDKVERGIIGPSHPGRAASRDARTRWGSDIPLPLRRARLRVNRFSEDGEIIDITA